MTKVSLKWAAEQLKLAEVPENVAEPVLILLDELNDAKADEPTYETIISIFASLALSRPIYEPAPEAEWRTVQRGFIRVSDIVRIKPDAFEGTAGEQQNGRVGRVVAIRSGNILVSTTDNREPKIESHHYDPEKLDKRVN